MADQNLLNNTLPGTTWQSSKGHHPHEPAMTFLKTTLQSLRWRGPSYLVYFVTGYLLPNVGYFILYKISRPLLILSGLALLTLLLAVPFEEFSDRYAIRFASNFLSRFSISGQLRPAWLIDLLTELLGLVLVSGCALVLWSPFRRRAIASLQRRAQALTEAAQPALSKEKFTSWSQLPVEPGTRAAIEVARQASESDELVIGRVDKNGRVLWLYGQIPGWEVVDEEGFAPRPHSRVEIVLLKHYVLVRKDFGAAREHFMREWCALVSVYGKANVPALYRVDEQRCLIYTNLIEGQKLLRVPATEELMRAIEDQLDAIHACGIASINLAPTNIIVDSKSGAPYLIDFENAQAYNSTRGPLFALRRDQDRVAFNQIYGRNILTEVSVRAAVAAEGRWGYAPVDFGRGVTAGQFWLVNSGTGRWEFLNSKVMPSVVGKRVLDLGSNNGSMVMMLLRAGAKEVIGLELNPRRVQRARLVQRIFEWRDLRKYAAHIYAANMLEILRKDWGQFDMATALCSLYYLPEEDMARVVQRAAELAPMMVLQANDSRREGVAKGKNEKKSVEFLQRILKENGFPYVQVFAPAKYSRPLLIGRKNPANETERNRPVVEPVQVGP